MIRIRQLRISPDKDNTDFIKHKVSKRLHIDKNDILDLRISKKGIDARDKNNIFYVYEVDVKTLKEEKILSIVKDKDVLRTPDEVYRYVLKRNSDIRPVIIGSGPAGLFSAFMLAEAGYKPLIIERGEQIEKRVKSVDEFWGTNSLNINSNVQFGEGGAGTFSDGKLNTLVKDKDYRMKKVFEIFISCGAPKEIMYIHNPHIGTDLLRKVVVNMRNKIIEMGGTFRFNTTLTDIIIEDNKVTGIILNDKDKIKCDTLVLAIGHSARDTFKMLYSKGLDMSQKPFAVGLRIVHPQELIDKNQYGESYKLLGHANYKLTYNTKKRGVYSFCMCPGGYVVNASSEKNRLVVNGMSNYNRDSGYSNSAIITTTTKEDFGEGIFDGMRFQEYLEEKSYELGDGFIPIQRYKDFKENRLSNIEQDLSFVKGKYKSSNLNDLFPEDIKHELIEAIDNFDKKIPGFKDAYVLGVESRSSSPVRIIRGENLESNIRGIYPCGEGAGYAGGITTSAIDGIKVSEKIGSAILKK